MGYEILIMIKANVTDKKVMAIGRSNIRDRSPLNIIKLCRTLFSVVGPKTTPIIKEATGKFHLERRKNPMIPAMTMIQTSNPMVRVEMFEIAAL